MSITKSQAEKIHKDLIAAMDAVAKKHGLKSCKGSLSYGEMLNLRVSFEVAGGKSKDELTYDRYQRLLGLPPLGFKFDNDSCVTAGLRVGGPYKSLIFKNIADGKLYKNAVAEMQRRHPVLNQRF